ncbi:uncharacterized protein LOC100383725 [Zea mays]|jgi:hypothetical protein|uniref:CCHC-type domain-containing protein n=2 Tax=Zea mays TaxID=4577 RepID=C0PIK3_MAIZE|nr:uncharacterized protein LOC100383725 [Zea mays]ACN35019.1 unknown [Zea mays]|eukprot:NP_001169833.1 uncharacterized protein LOC100383725 [Zea mays]
MSSPLPSVSSVSPKEILVHKAEEFRKLKQGTQRVQEYASVFTKMMRYAPDETSTDKKKQYWFKQGLHRALRTHLATHDFPSLCHMVSKAIVVERERLDYEDSVGFRRKRTGPPNRLGPSQRPQTGLHQSSRGTPCPSASVPSPSYGNTSYQNPSYPKPAASHQAVSVARPAAPAPSSGSSFIFTCFACRNPGHRAADCPSRRQPVYLRPRQYQTPAKSPATGGTPQASQVRVPPPAARGRLNNLTTEDAADASDVALGEFLVNNAFATVLFDSGATSSYVSSKFAAQ